MLTLDKLKKDKLSYAFFLRRKALLFMGLTLSGNPVENLTKSITNYNEAALIFNKAENPLDYADTKKDLGNAYLARASYASGQTRLDKGY